MITYRIFGKTALPSKPILEPCSRAVSFCVEGLRGVLDVMLTVEGESFQRSVMLVNGEATVNLSVAPNEVRVTVGDADAGRLEAIVRDGSRYWHEPILSAVELEKRTTAIAIHTANAIDELTKLMNDCRALVPVVEDLFKKARSGDILDF